MNNANEPDGAASELMRWLAATCPECGGRDTEWHCGQYSNSGAADGRLRMHEVRTRFFLGCPVCGETIRVVDGDDMAAMMTRAANV